MWTYIQRTGKLYHDGALIGAGYSGHGQGLNNPAMDDIHDVGPLPAGNYSLTEWRDNDLDTGRGTIVLVPAKGTNTHGRGGFRIHGDNAAMNQSASHGCIVIGNAEFRRRIWDTGEHYLEVAADQAKTQT